ncbi:hypothetical protein CEXT_306881 [Caerostris extrusa]|uniref:Uncharacterized protein n=1 Tax=Caerostris extrusa TaxID=172846 RepID=A0AAV4XTJ4_CAEEX|nr:hypothetical protein CEXT_306881 [Caerostris extrusa]
MKHPPGSQQCKSKSKLSAPQAPFIYMALEPGVIRVPTPIPHPHVGSHMDMFWQCYRRGRSNLNKKGLIGSDMRRAVRLRVDTSHG